MRLNSPWLRVPEGIATTVQVDLAGGLLVPRHYIPQSDHTSGSRTEENELTGDNRDRRAVFRDQASSVATGRKDENCARVLLGRSCHSSHSDSLDGLRGAFCGVAKLVE